jgi:hypothetical protein
MSDVSSSLAEVQARLCLLITNNIFLFQQFILLGSELDFGRQLQQRNCYKFNVIHDPKCYWEINREPVWVKMTKKRNNVT